MNDPMLSDFVSDLDRVSGQLDLIEKLRQLAGEDDAPMESDVIHEGCVAAPGNASSYVSICRKVWESTKQAHSSLAILEGTLVLYIAGRFEEFVRSSIEDLCDRLINRLGSFTALPKAMQDSLIRQTAAVMLDPRKYGHAENGVRAFVTTLAANFSNPKGVIQTVNSQCLSISDANMRPEVLADLFKRVGIKEIWRQIAQQAVVLAHFQTGDASIAEASAKRALTELMEDRNRVAHPSGSFDWPASPRVRDYVIFLAAIATALSALIPVFETSLGTPANLVSESN